MVGHRLRDGTHVREAKRLPSGDVQVVAVTRALRRVVVVVPYARSSWTDIQAMVEAAATWQAAHERRPK